MTTTDDALEQPRQVETEASIRQAAIRTRNRRRFWLWTARLGFAVFVIGGWQLATSKGWLDPFFYGQPSLIWKSLVQLFTQGTEFGSIWGDIGTTLKEAVYGFILGAAAGITVGLLLGQNRFLADVLSPYIKVVNAVPRIILGSIFLVAFGLGTFPKVLLAAVLVFFIVFFNAFQGVREVNPNLVANVRVLGASPLQVARHVTIPSAMTWIVASLHTAFGFAIIGALVGEVLGSQRGIGLVISQAQGKLDPNTVFAGMVIMAVITLVAESLITLLERRVLSWRPPTSAEIAAGLSSRLTREPPNTTTPNTKQQNTQPKGTTRMFRRTMTFAAIGALALGAAACSSNSTANTASSSTSSAAGSAAAGPSSSGASAASAPTAASSPAASAAAAGGSASSMAAASTPSGPTPTVKLMVGGIDKQIYLPYQLAQSLGLYKKYGVNVELSTEVNGGVGAEDAMASGQVDMAGAWYIHTIDFQSKGKNVIDVVQLSGAPGEREMCGNNSGVHSAADFKGKTLGVTDLGSGTDELTQFLASQHGLTRKDYHTLAVGAGATAIAAIERNTAQCVMTTQPTVGAMESKKIGYSAIDLATTKGAQEALGGAWPAAGVLATADWVNSHKEATQRVVNALVATMHWINTHSATDIANALPQQFVSNSTISKDQYIAGLTTDKGQFLPDGIMPAGGPKTIYSMEKTLGTDVSKVTLANTFTNAYATLANKLEGTSMTTPPAGSAG